MNNIVTMNVHNAGVELLIEYPDNAFQLTLKLTDSFELTVFCKDLDTWYTLRSALPKARYYRFTQYVGPDLLTWEEGDQAAERFYDTAEKV